MQFLVAMQLQSAFELNFGLRAGGVHFLCTCIQCSVASAVVTWWLLQCVSFIACVASFRFLCFAQSLAPWLPGGSPFFGQVLRVRSDTRRCAFVFFTRIYTDHREVYCSWSFHLHWMLCQLFGVFGFPFVQ